MKIPEDVFRIKAMLYIKLHPELIMNNSQLNHSKICEKCKLGNQCSDIFKSDDDNYVYSINGLNEGCWAFLDVESVIKKYNIKIDG